MEASDMEKIDIYCHILPEKYRQKLYQKARSGLYLEADGRLDTHHDSVPALFDMDRRFRIMDQFEGMKQVLTIAAPPLEAVAAPDTAVELAQIANDEMAELVAKYPDRFVAAVAYLPMNDMEASLREAERAIEDLNLSGVLVYSPVEDKALDAPEFLPLYEMMAGYGLPIWLHPIRDRSTADYKSETFSKYRIFHIFGWPYETSAAMTRLVFSGVLDRHPDLRFITHHCGGMIPFFSERLAGQGRRMMSQFYVEEKLDLSRPPIEYFKLFYGDTALGSTPGLMCGYSFFGADHILFGTDMPFGGAPQIAQAIDSVEKMSIPESDKHLIFHGNTRKLLKLG